jgi:pSer/pThr/pTyr-binding forkhead associated (FHA) protein
MSNSDDNLAYEESAKPTVLYEIEVLTPSLKYNSGTKIPVSSSKIKIGRDDSCAISFGDEFSTVSREHVSIERRGSEDYFLKNLSKTNQTLLKSKPVIKEYRLNHGDEIQLSVDGPRIRFLFPLEVETVEVRKEIVVEKNKSLTYLLVGLILVLSVGAGISIYFLYFQSDHLLKESAYLRGQIENQQVITRDQADRIARLNADNEQLSDLFNQTSSQLEDYQKYAREMAQNLSQIRAKSDSLLALDRNRIDFIDLINPLKTHVYAIYLEKVVTSWHNNSREYNMDQTLACSGFLVQGGLFITSRQCLDSFIVGNHVWNLIDHSGGEVRLYFTAVNSDGTRRFNFSNTQIVSSNKDDAKIGTEFDGVAGVKRIPDYSRGSDWAVVRTQYNDGLIASNLQANRLAVGDQLFSLGFSSADVYTQNGPGQPLFALTRLTRMNNQTSNFQITDTGYDKGSIGSPLFTIDNNNRPILIGILSGKIFDPTNELFNDIRLNTATPISNINSEN